MKLTILGSNSATPAYGRFPSSQVLEVNGKLYLIDCSEGTLYRMMQNHISYQKLEAIFISHLHGDHYLGLLGLLTTMSMHMRTKPITIVSPPGIEEIISVQCKYSNTHIRFPITYLVVDSTDSDIVYSDETINVVNIPLDHKIQTQGYKFGQKIKYLNIKREAIEQYQLTRESINSIRMGEDYITPLGERIPNADLTIQKQRPKVYAYCSDTVYKPSIVELLRGVDTLYHEATFLESERQRAIETKHSTAGDAALIARAAEVKSLIIGHYSSRYIDLTPLLDEAKSIFDSTLLAYDGRSYDI